MSGIESIKAYFCVDENLSTSGMPRPEQFADIAQAGFEVVINLALPTSDNALPNEGELVTRAGMTYIHIPVNFENPPAADFERFTRLLSASAGQKVWVHCAANMRVSAFVFLHRLRTNSASRADAERDLRRIWEPEDAWRELLNAQLVKMGQNPL
ncbi:MAG TPA: protein tyrosine phosphatase family protein [Verrucomicrobiae bacterium]